jgi:hypothetical protein
VKVEEPEQTKPKNEEQKDDSKLKVLSRHTSLAQLQLPGNFPELAIYFGSQTGTAEKFAN